MKVLLARAAGACVMACWALTSTAAESTLAPTQTLSLRDALSLATQRNPELAAFVPQATALREQATLQALGPASNVELQFENFAGSGELSGIESLESTLQLSHVIELGGKPGLRRQVGDTELAQLTAQQRARHVDVLADVARRFIDVLAAQEKFKATQRAVTLAEETVSAVRSRVEAGAASPVQTSRATIALARAQLDVAQAEHALSSARVALTTLWNEEAPVFSSADGALFDLGAPEPFERYRQRLDDNPELLTFASSQRVLEARTRLADVQRRPNLTFNVGVRRLEGVDDSALVAGISLPLGSKRRADMELRSVQAERAALTLTEQSRRLELHSTLFALYQELAAARSEAQALQERIRPQARDMLRTTQDGYRAGRFSFLELADAQRQLLDIELEAIAAAVRFHQQLNEIERITGQPAGKLAQENFP